MERARAWLPSLLFAVAAALEFAAAGIGELPASYGAGAAFSGAGVMLLLRARQRK